MKKYIIALDQGTTSSRTLIFDEAGLVVATSQREFTQYYPNDGWVEHIPEEIWQGKTDSPPQPHDHSRPRT